MRRFSLLLALPLALVACGGAPESQAPVPHFVPDEAAMRTVLVGETGAPDAGGPIRAGLLEGRMPSAPTTAVVLTDEDCAPDFAGISHCRNELRLADGTRISVRHHHDMQRYSCLSPGEKVRVVPA